MPARRQLRIADTGRAAGELGLFEQFHFTESIRLQLRRGSFKPKTAVETPLDEPCYFAARLAVMAFVTGMARISAAGSVCVLGSSYLVQCERNDVVASGDDDVLFAVAKIA